MARNQRFTATWFVRPDGVCIPKDRPTPTRLRREVFDRDDYECQLCGVEVTWNAPQSLNWLTDPRQHGHVDHVFPRARGGQTTLDNLRLTCVTCNESKAAD